MSSSDARDRAEFVAARSPRAGAEKSPAAYAPRHGRDRRRRAGRAGPTTSHARPRARAPARRASATQQASAAPPRTARRRRSAAARAGRRRRADGRRRPRRRAASGPRPSR
ncbi:MAG: hypothetical protein MZV64_42260 [Ignavibacteriales bacterium]|nr:hypothetical protein [Ignavibacteriales bacterium]